MPVARVSGSVRAILTGERTALNLLGRLSGIATATRRYVDAVAGTGVAILDTRKTTPGLRALEKQAVATGGGRNHRFGLDDGVLVKDNHFAATGSIRAAVERLRAATDLPVEVECDTLEQLEEALAAGADAVLLDNMSLGELRRAVALTEGRARLEASGGVTLETVRPIAETGVDEYLDRRAHAFRTSPRRLTGAHVTTLEIETIRDRVDSRGSGDPVLPDMYLGLWLEKVTGRKLRIWLGECRVHAGNQPQDIERWQADAPDAELLVHPECGCASQCMAFGNGRTHILSTEGMINFARRSPKERFLVATETGSSTGSRRRRRRSVSKPSPRRQSVGT